MIYFNLFFNFLLIYFILIFVFINLAKLTIFFKIQTSQNYICLLYGFCFFLIISNFLYFFLKLEINQIFYFIIVLCISIFFREIFINLKNIRNYFNNFFLTFIGCLPVLVIFLYLSIEHGEQYYVFRGNQYDYFNYISQIMLFKKYSIEQIINNKNVLSKYFPYKNMINFHLDIRPAISLYFSVFNFEKIGIFLNSFILKTFAFNLIFFASYSFFYNYTNKILYTIIYSLVFTFSFWAIYIYEIDSLAQLFSMSLSIIFIGKLLNFFNTKKDDKKIIIELTLILSGILLVYPEQGIIICLITLLMFILNIDYARKYFLKHYKFVLKYFFVLIIVLLPNYKGTIFFLFEQSKVGLTNINNFWGYFGAFILGQESIILQNDIVENVKGIIKNSNSNLNVFKNIHNLQLENGYKYYFLNIIPALFGMLHFTLGKIDFINLKILFLFMLNLFIFYTIFINAKVILQKKYSIEKDLFISSIICFVFITSILIFNNAFWGIIKLFFYLSFIFYFFIIFPINSKKNIQINSIILFFIILFPLSHFNYTKNNMRNSMPTIMKPYLKENIKWGINEDLTQCSQITSKIKDFFVLKYIGIQVQDKSNLLLNKIYNKSSEQFDCEIILYNKKFKVIKK